MKEEMPDYETIQQADMQLGEAKRLLKALGCL